MAMHYIFTTDKTLCISINGNYACIPGDHPNYVKIRDAVLSGDTSIDELCRLCDIDRAIVDYSDGRVQVTNGKVTWQGEECRGVVKDAIIAMMKKGHKPVALVRFLDNLMENPSAACVDALFEWMRRGHIALTPDGYVLGYKAVRLDWTDHYSGKFKNTPGSHHKLRRNQVDDDRKKLCSYGFHIGTPDYARIFHRGDSRLVITKFHPRDVVSVPTEASDEKIRVCEYKVISEWNGVDPEDILYDVDEVKHEVKPTPGEPDKAWFDNDTEVHSEDEYDESDYEWWEDDEDEDYDTDDCIHYINE